MSPAARRAQRADAIALRELAAVPRWLWDGESLPVPIESIAEDHYGILVEEHHSLDAFATAGDAHVSGVLLRARGRILVDALEAARAPGRKRFTIAHELGHLVLDDEEAGPRVGQPDLTERRARRPVGACDQPAALAYPPGELEANQFAAAMLMPARHLRAAGISRRERAGGALRRIRGGRGEAARVPGVADWPNSERQLLPCGFTHSPQLGAVGSVAVAHYILYFARSCANEVNGMRRMAGKLLTIGLYGIPEGAR